MNLFRTLLHLGHPIAEAYALGSVIYEPQCGMIFIDLDGNFQFQQAKKLHLAPIAHLGHLRIWILPNIHEDMFGLKIKRELLKRKKQ